MDYRERKILSLCSIRLHGTETTTGGLNTRRKHRNSVSNTGTMANRWASATLK